MAFLRRGLLSQKGVVPSIHTRQKSDTSTLNVQADTPAPCISFMGAVTGNDQPVIKKVLSIVRMAEQSHHYHLVNLECGHIVQSKSTFQGYCKTCKS